MTNENKGYAAYLLLVSKIKELKSFNTQLKYQIIRNAPKSKLEEKNTAKWCNNQQLNHFLLAIQPEFTFSSLSIYIYYF